MPAVLVIDGEIDTAVYNTVSGQGVLTITPTGGAAPTTICPKLPVLTQTQSYFSRDEGAMIAAGQVTPPTAPYAAIQELDYAAPTPFLMLKHSHLGSTDRWRNSSNVGLNYSSSPTGDGLVRCYLSDFEFYTIPQTAANVAAAHTAIAASTIAGGGWYPVPRSLVEMLYDYMATGNTSTQPPPGFHASWHILLMMATFNEQNTTQVYTGLNNATRRDTAVSNNSSVSYIMCRRMNSY